MVAGRTASPAAPGLPWNWEPSMSQRVKSQNEGPDAQDVFSSETESGYLEGYDGREFEETPEHTADFSDPGDWGRQGEWGTFSNRPAAGRNEQEWAQIEPSESLAEKADPGEVPRANQPAPPKE